MGICKCKKRSEDFCYQHKKFVCDDCVIPDHPVCYINSYVNWLTDSEPEEPVCEICKDELNSENSVRLCCYHIFHPECIDVYANSLPPNTTSAGYVCPKCSKPIIPNNESNSPLAQNIKKIFSISPWAEIILHSFNSSKKMNTGGSVDLYNIQGQPIYNNNNNTGNGNSPNLDHDINSNGSNSHALKLPISPSLLEETPPLNHLNSNPYGLAIRKQQQLQQHLGSPTISHQSSQYPGNNSDTIIQFENNSQLDFEEDKYNKKITLSNYFSNHLIPFFKEKPIRLVIPVLVLLFFIFIIFRGGGEDEISSTSNIPLRKETTPN
ncbi:hypothetical protein DLAC_10037 [Tieghemostelium lacteum]|uniref:RING-type domain-containing protein n=1 Tax=Tieghemostelium lacteum TaxID=361077 RepID=A0A151Z5Z2_TIELA|nr:hypothetical protein DLAC_10037 [Tieghemostelium lacteum]|eukprot:KYQ89376.1 hypothetical protein DLAC_10037 [Tieghemostelium lacteum]